jgi:hypothetical protein
MAKKPTKVSAIDLLSQLQNQVVEISGKDNSERPVIDEDTSLMMEYAGVHAVSKIADAKKKLVGDELKDQLWKKFTENWFTQKVKPGNPKIVSKLNGREDCVAIYQIKAVFTVKAVPDHPSARGAVTTALELVGIHPEVANRIYDENIDVEIITALRPFNELAHGRYVSGVGGREFVPATEVQKSAANKLLAVATGAADASPLTNEERNEAIIRESRYVVKAGFMERAVNYCQTVDQLRKLLTVIEPQPALSGVKFAAASSETEQATRTLNVMRELLGLEVA